MATRPPTPLGGGLDFHQELYFIPYEENENVVEISLPSFSFKKVIIYELDKQDKH